VAVGLVDTAAPTASAELQTAAGSVAGTVAYMSPEQAQGKPVDPRTDIFSFGIVVYEMLTGHRPFTGDSAAQVLSAILRDDPPPARSLRKDLPEELDRILSKALAKDAELRYQHVADVVADLKRVSRGAASARPEAPPSRFRRPAAWLASAAALLALAALLGPRVFPRRRAPVQFRLVSTFPGSHRSPSLSPDGRMMAFIDAARETPEVWVKPLGEGDPDPDHVGRPDRRQSHLVAQRRCHRLRPRAEGALVGTSSRGCTTPDPGARELRELLPGRRAARVRPRSGAVGRSRRRQRGPPRRGRPE
jgi:serine/threonine protein kinase